VVANALVLVTDTLSGNYVDACRMIRIDGFWRTASDLYERQFGLLETTMAQGSTPAGDQRCALQRGPSARIPPIS
jgi:hypothetical protein